MFEQSAIISTPSSISFSYRNKTKNIEEDREEENEEFEIVAWGEE